MKLRKDSKAIKNIQPELHIRPTQSLSKLVAGKKLIHPKVTASELKPSFTLKTSLIRNDGQLSSLRELINYKNIVCTQLPKMPKNYITKLLFDRRHQCLVALTEDGKMIGGACFRCFKDRTFSELVFMVVNHEQKRRGVGSQIMDHLKECLQQKGVSLMLTYADNSAVGFFRKQAFNKVLETEQKQWSGYIKVYEGGTLMECKIENNFKYTCFRETLKMQINYILKTVKQNLVGQQRYSISVLKKIIDKHKSNERVDLLLVPGVLQNGWCQQYEQQFQKQPQISLILELLYGIDIMRKIPFAKFVKDLQLFDELHIPIDLSIVEKKIICGCYFHNFEELQADLKTFLTSVNQKVEVTSHELENKVTSILDQLRLRELTLQQLDCVFKETRSKKSTKSTKQ